VVWNEVDLVDQCLSNLLVFPTQELVKIVKDLKGQLNELKGTNHARRFQTQLDELKKYCLAFDVSETVALSKLYQRLKKQQRSQSLGIG